MKKYFTLLFCAPVFLFAQQPVKIDTKAFKEANARQVAEVQSPVINKLKPASLNKTNGDKPLYGATTIGNTEYDLQTNNAVDRRIKMYPGNKITAVWTTSSDGGPSYGQRGTGYNQYVGGTWRKALPNNTRIETSRVGWPSLGVATFGGVEKEYIFAHAVATSGITGGFVFSKNNGVGTDFVEGSGKVLDDTYNAATTPGPIWGRVATAGTRIILISCFADSTQNYPVNQYMGGIKRPVTYSVYDAAGQTWIKKNQLLPGYDSTRYDIGQADSYSIDAVGNKVRIVIGGAFDDLALWKSEDAGTTWTKTVIDSFARAKATPSTPVRDRKQVNNGSVNVIIDQAGVTHVVVPTFASAFDSVDPVTQARTTYYSTNTEGIQYWNDKINGGTGMADPIRTVAFTPDQDGDNMLTLATNTRNGAFGGYGSGLGTGRITAIANQPMLSHDAAGNLFLTFIAPIEADESGDQENYNDIFVVASKNGGTTWSTTSQNLTKTTGFEDIYPATVKISDTKLRMMYFLKDDPGISVNNAGNPASTIRVNYMEVPTSKILNDSVGIFPNGIDNELADAGFTVSQNYPNPFNGTTQINFSITKNADITFTVSDILGKVLYTEIHNNTESGNHTINFNSGNMSKGIYFYTLSTGAQNVTEKMIVE